MYYFDGRKRTLEDMDIYGRITPDNYRSSVFLAGDHNLIMGIKETGSCGDSMTAEDDFRKKFREADAIKQRTVWTVLMRFTSPETRKVIADSLHRYFREAGCQEFFDIQVCRYEPVKDLPS
jgi:hypothetical protein